MRSLISLNNPDSAPHVPTRPPVGCRVPDRWRRPLVNLKERGDRLIPSGKVRRAVIWMWVAGVAMGYAGTHATNTEPLVRVTFGITAGAMSAVFGIARLGSLAAIFITTHSDRINRKNAFLASFGLALLASAATALANTVVLFTVLQTVTRLAVTAGALIATVIVVETVQGRGRTYAVSLFGAAVSLGAGLATAALPIGDLTAEGWRWIFASSTIGLMAIPGLIRAIDEPPKAPEAVLPGWFDRLDSRPDFWRMSASSFSFAMFSSVAVAFLIEHLIGALDMTARQAAVVALAGGTVGGIGFFVGSGLANRIGRKYTTYLAVLTSTVGGVALYQATDPWWVGGFAALSAFGSFLLIPSFGVWRNEMFAPAIRTRAVTWINNAGIIGSIAGLFIASHLIDEIGLPATVAMLSLASGAALATLIAVPEPRPSHVEQTSPSVE